MSSMYNKNSKKHFGEGIEESWIDHRSKLLVLFKHPAITDQDYTELEKYALIGNALSYYRSILRDWKP